MAKHEQSLVKLLDAVVKEWTSPKKPENRNNGYIKEKEPFQNHC